MKFGQDLLDAAGCRPMTELAASAIVLMDMAHMRGGLARGSSE